MANPNIVNVAAIYGQMALVSAGATPTTIVTNSAASNTVCKIDSLYCSNGDNASSYLITIAYYIQLAVHVLREATYIPV